VTNRIRNEAAALLLLVCLVTFTSAFNLPNRSGHLSARLASLNTAANPAQQHIMLTLADRVAYQRAIEEVYWRHRIWPKERPDPKPSLDEMMSSARLKKKVEDYLHNSETLEDYWKERLSAEQLQAEMERMAQHTKQPEVLRELFEALGNDPFVIAECLARPALSERLAANFYAHDEGAAIKKTQDRLELATVERRKEPFESWRTRVENQMPSTVAVAANYTLPTISPNVNGCADDTWTATSTTNAPSARDSHTAVWTGSEMIVWGGLYGLWQLRCQYRWELQSQHG